MAFYLCLVTFFSDPQGKESGKKWLHLLCNTIYYLKEKVLLVFVPKKLPWLAKNIGRVSGEPEKATEEVESINI
jgi:hypothetical protein